MTFNELTYGIAFISPLLGALSEGRKAGFVGVLVALLVETGLGICSFLLTKELFRCVSRHPQLGVRNPEGVWMLLVWVSCMAMFVGIGGIGVLGMVATRFITSYVAG